MSEAQRQDSVSHREAALGFLRLATSGRIGEAYATYVDEAMRHHNPWFAGDAASLRKGMEENHAKFPRTAIEVKRAVEDGDLVMVHSHVRMKPEEPGVAVVHIFRFRGDRIVEMWDVGQPIPAESPNRNGMF